MSRQSTNTSGRKENNPAGFAGLLGFLESGDALQVTGLFPFLTQSTSASNELTTNGVEKLQWP
jgi:hypothetical protein